MKTCFVEERGERKREEGRVGGRRRQTKEINRPGLETIYMFARVNARNNGLIRIGTVSCGNWKQ